MSIPYSQIQNHKDRLLLERLDELINILINQRAEHDLFLRGLVASAVPMAPAFSQTIIVGPTAVFLVENTVMSLMRVEITNDDIAISLYVGNRDVTIPAGRVIQPNETVVFILAKGQSLYGIIAAGASNAIISFSESAYGSIISGPVVM